MTIKDGDWELFDYDAQSGKSTWRWFDGKDMHFRTDYPVDAVLAENTAVRNEAGRAWAGDWHRVASVPLNVFWRDLAEAQSHGDDAYLSRWLNDSDNRAWRTKEGKV